MATNDEILGDRRRALEEEFFRRQDEKLRAQFREQEHRRQVKQELAQASGITDDAVLAELIALGIQARTLAPLALVPLVEVAWADGRIDSREREAILKAAQASGVESDSPGYGLLGGWLSVRPESSLRELWMQYTRSLCETLDAAARRALKADILGRARQVAEAAGGFLGLGSKVSAAEEAVLTELARAFGE
jgi:hypothetical protein